MQSGILSGGVMPTRQLRKVLDGDSGVWGMAALAGGGDKTRFRAHLRAPSWQLLKVLPKRKEALMEGRTFFIPQECPPPSDHARDRTRALCEVAGYPSRMNAARRPELDRAP